MIKNVLHLLVIFITFMVYFYYIYGEYYIVVITFMGDTGTSSGCAPYSGEFSYKQTKQ